MSHSDNKSNRKKWFKKLLRLFGGKRQYFLGLQKSATQAELPDGFFSNQKSQFGQILEGLRWENLYIYIVAFWNI
jgi:hypothetical protein